MPNDHNRVLTCIRHRYPPPFPLFIKQKRTKQKRAISPLQNSVNEWHKWLNHAQPSSSAERLHRSERITYIVGVTLAVTLVLRSPWSHGRPGPAVALAPRSPWSHGRPNLTVAQSRGRPFPGHTILKKLWSDLRGNSRKYRAWLPPHKAIVYSGVTLETLVVTEKASPTASTIGEYDDRAHE